MLTAEKAQEIYEDTVRDLRARIESHICPSGKSSVKAFCDEYGINRSNLVSILTSVDAGNTQKTPREMSVGLFQKICVILGLIGENCTTDEAAFYNLSLRLYMRINNNAILHAVMMLK